MAATIGGRIELALAEGQSLEAVLAAKVTADYDARWDYRPGFFIDKDGLVTTIYTELAAQP